MCGWICRLGDSCCVTMALSPFLGMPLQDLRTPSKRFTLWRKPSMTFRLTPLSNYGTWKHSPLRGARFGSSPNSQASIDSNIFGLMGRGLEGSRWELSPKWRQSNKSTSSIPILSLCRMGSLDPWTLSNWPISVGIKSVPSNDGALQGSPN